jgi:hypothetical protein
MSAARVLACECVGSSTPTQALDQSAAVFSGQVVAITHGTRWVDAKAKRPPDCFLMGTFDEAGIALCEDEDYLVTFEVFNSWKGLQGERVEVRTTSQGPACGFDFRVRQAYLVYASASGPNGSLTTGFCTRTRRIADAQKDVEILGKPQRNFIAERAARLGHKGGS